MEDPTDTAQGGLLRAEYMTQMTEAEAVALRAPYLRHERRLRLVGWALLLGWPAVAVGGFCLVAVLVRVMVFVNGGYRELHHLYSAGLVLLAGTALVVMGIASCAAAFGLQNLDAERRRLSKGVVLLWMLSSLVLFCWAVYDWMVSGGAVSGGAVSGGLPLPLSLWAYTMVTCSASDVVFSPEYKEARLLTPHLNRESATTGFVLLVLVVAAPLALLCSRC